jgi:hypothetical protein
MTLLELHKKISDYLLTKVPSLQAVYYYNQTRANIPAPVGFLEVTHMDIGADPGTEELPVVLNFTLRILVDASINAADIALQTLLLEAALAVYHTNFGLPLTMTQELGISYENIADAENVLVGAISWKNEMHFGENVWIDASWIPPHHINAVYSEQNMKTDNTKLDGNVTNVENIL